MNTSFIQGELLSPHPYRLEVSVGKDSQLLFKMSPCLLDTPIAVTTWQTETQSRYCKLPPSLDFFFLNRKKTGVPVSSDRKMLFKIPCYPCPRYTLLSPQYLTAITI